jgi:hypothetical protein
MPETVFYEKEMMMTIETNQIATFANIEYGIASLVTQISKGYAVTLLDTDAEQVVATKIYPSNMLAQAMVYAKSLAGVAA